MDGWMDGMALFRGVQIFQTSRSPPQNSRRRKSDTKQVRCSEHPNICILKKLRGGERYPSIVDDQIILTGKCLQISAVSSDW
jgi:hypothetical protein